MSSSTRSRTNRRLRASSQPLPTTNPPHSPSPAERADLELEPFCQPPHFTPAQHAPPHARVHGPRLCPQPRQQLRRGLAALRCSEQLECERQGSPPAGGRLCVTRGGAAGGGASSVRQSAGGTCANMCARKGLPQHACVGSNRQRCTHHAVTRATRRCAWWQWHPSAAQRGPARGARVWCACMPTGAGQMWSCRQA